MKNGLTKREFMENAGQPVPDVEIPDGMEYIWEWFWDVNSLVNRAGNGYCKRITPDDYAGWERMSGNIVRSDEYDILRAMDHAFVTEMNQQMQAAGATNG